MLDGYFVKINFLKRDFRVQMLGFPGGACGKEPACRTHKRHGFSPWVGKIPWRRTWQPTPVFLPGEFHGQRSLATTDLWVAKSDTIERLTISSSVAPFSFWPQSFPASRSFPVSQFFASGPKYWSFSFRISPFNEYSGLIFCQIDRFDLAVQGTLKSLL